jgi:hypothetical protein
MMNRAIKAITVLLVLSCARVSFAQYNPMTETPLQIIDKIPGVSHTLAQQSKPAPITNADGEEIPFDPEHGIIIPGEGTQRPSLRPKERAEDYLIMQADKAMSHPVVPETEDVIDPNKSYIERQIEELIARVKIYTQIAIKFIKEMLPLLWHVVKICNLIFMSLAMPIIRLPVYISLPLLFLLYFLICYPLRKIAHTITNDEWMALVFPLQFVLLLRITERSYWSLILFLIPGVNLIFLTIIFKEICELLRQPPYYSILILVPGLNIALLWYLAYVGFD